MPYLTTPDGTEIFYNDWGSGRPVVLIHGWPLHSDMWEHQATFLVEQGLRVIAYDRRGFGRSSQPWTGYDYDTLASDLHALTEALDLRDATIVGFSMGGGEVVRYLSTYGTVRVTKAALVSAVPPFLLQTDNNPDGVPEKVFAGIAEQLRKDRPAFLDDFIPKFYGRTTLKHTVSQPVLDWTQTMAMTGSLRATLAAATSWATTDFRAEMPGITVPTLVIHGGSDSTVPATIAGQKSAALLPNSTYIEYDGEPHGLTLTAGDRLNEDLLRFIGGTAEPVTDANIA